MDSFIAKSIFNCCIFAVLAALISSCVGNNTADPPVMNKKIGSLPIEQSKTEVTIPVIKETQEWVNLGEADTTLVLDIKYATTDNFVKEKMYECGQCYLRPVVAKKILAAHRELQKKGLGIKLFDCYRPRPVQQKLWDKVPNPNYVTPPDKGSMHNRGVAVDLTIVNQDGKELNMGTSYDFFGKEAHHTYKNHSQEVQDNRNLLRNLMLDVQLKPIRTEWWHYSYQQESFEISDWEWPCPADR